MIKKALISIALSSSLMFGAGIPVIDAVANAQSLEQNIKTIQEWATEADRWANTVSHYNSQLTAYQNELLSKTGIRDSVNFVKDLNRLQQYSNIYGDDYLDLTKALANKNSLVGNQARQLFDKYNVFDRCENDKFKDWEKQSCQNKLEREVTQIATVQQTQTILSESATNLELLGTRVSNSQDIKESQDIANAIELEKANIQMAQMRLDMLEKQNNAVAQAEDERKERNYESLKGKYNDWSSFDWSFKNN